LQADTKSLAAPQPERGQSGNCLPPKFSQTYVFVWCSNKLHHFALPEDISWLRPWSIVYKLQTHTVCTTQVDKNRQNRTFCNGVGGWITGLQTLS